MSVPAITYYGAWRGDRLADVVSDERFRWLIEHLSRPDGAGGRQVCPWAIVAQQEGRFYVGDARQNPSDASTLAQIIENLVVEYRSYDTFRPPNKHPATLTVLIPDQIDGELITAALDRYRRQFTPLGIMLGALDPFNSLRSLTGGKGCPYVAPWNFLTVRWMVPGDYVFLNLDPDYKRIYCNYFGSWPEGTSSQ